MLIVNRYFLGLFEVEGDGFAWFRYGGVDFDRKAFFFFVSWGDELDFVKRIVLVGKTFCGFIYI